MSRTFSQYIRRISDAARAFAFWPVGTVASGWLGSPARKARAARAAASIQHGGREEPRSATEPCPYVATTSRPSPCGGVGCLPVIPAKEAVIQFPPANLRLQNGHVRIASVDTRIANSTTSLEKQPLSPPDFGSIGAKARSWNWITASKAGTYAAWVPAFTLGDSHISKTYVIPTGYG